MKHTITEFLLKIYLHEKFDLSSTSIPVKSIHEIEKLRSLHKRLDDATKFYNNEIKKIDLSYTDIPYDEIAKIYANIDMNEIEKSRRLHEASELFEDVIEFFESPDKQKYLVAVISKSNVENILNELQECFLEAEQFEKCAQIQKFKEKLK
jgi:hypothetical protein